MKQRNTHRGGFALPTVLIASIVMLSVLTVAVSSVAAVRTSLKTQYYEQLAKVAGEAGVAYAKACLAKNGNVALWTNAKPLKPNTDCSGNDISGITCPGDARCAVTVSGNVRSSFSVIAPTVNAEGKAITIPNSGYVELLRASNGQVWRTYQQPAVQVAVVPDLCSGAAASGLGWSNAVAASSANSASIADATGATTITRADSTLPAGQMYFRRDFPVATAGTYRVSGLTNSSKDKVELYIDGNLVTTSQGSLANGDYYLPVGCHTITARLTNNTVLYAYSQFTAAVNLPGSSSPVVATDTAWRVSSGAAVTFSNTNYYMDSSIWGGVTNYSTTLAQLVNSSWTATTGDPFTPMISPSGNGCPSACPAATTAYMRDSKEFYAPENTDVTVSAVCDDACGVYLDGKLVLNYNSWSSIGQQTVTLPGGFYRLAVQLYNGGSSAGTSGAAVSVVQKSGTGAGTVLARTDTTWKATNTWHSGIGGNIGSYEAVFKPSPNEITDPVLADVLIVGGGGGGGRNAAGGGGGGGVIYLKDFQLSATTYNIIVGSGGAAATANTVAGSAGGYSQFINSTYRSLGGGGGASRDGGSAAGSGGSGGGGAGASVAARTPGGTGTAGQGNNGGAGTTADAGTNSTGGGGGGAGGPGMYGVSGGAAGNGGAGLIFYITGTRLGVGGGGAGAYTSAGSVGTGTDGGGSGSQSIGNAVTIGATNTGGGGGASGGAGGSGVVVIRFKTGTLTVDEASANMPASTYTKTTTVLDGVNYTIYRFTTSSNFVVSAVNPS